MAKTRKRSEKEKSSKKSNSSMNPGIKAPRLSCYPRFSEVKIYIFSNFKAVNVSLLQIAKRDKKAET